jgi:hypothetical protein
MSPAKNPQTKWTAEMESIVEKRYADTPTAKLAKLLGTTESAVYWKARVLGIKKSAEYLAGPHACRLRLGDGGNIGKPYRFKKGGTPWNKGLLGIDLGGKETRFKPGHISGMAAEACRPIGTERESKGGYLERKVHDGMPLQSRWRAVHLIVWEAENGPLPPGHVIAFKDSDKRNFALANLELVSRAEMMRRNSYHNYGPEVARLVQLKGAITRQINKREKQA